MSKLIDKILKNSTTKYTSILSESEFFNEKDVIPCDIPIFNIAFSGDLNGGLSSGLTLLAGVSKTFKSAGALVCVRAYLNKYPDAVCIFYDSEGGITPEYLKSQGIDPSRVVHIPIEHLEMLKFDMVKQLKELDRGDKVIIVIDSIGNTASLKELQDALDERTVAEMQRAKVLKGLFRMVTPALVTKDIPCIAIAHTYEEMGSMYAKQVISGGSGLLYSCNQAFIISKAQEKDSDGLSGWNFTLNVEKSRYVKEKSKLTFQVLYNKGIQKYSGLLDIAMSCGLIVKPNMGWYSKVGEERKYRLKDLNTDEFWDPILKDQKFHDAVSNKYKLTSSFISDTADEAELKEILDNPSE